MCVCVGVRACVIAERVNPPSHFPESKQKINIKKPNRDQPVATSCPDGLEQLRTACGATLGRKSTHVITVADGQIQGFVDPDSTHAEFRGIPYAAAPVDDLRWRPPQPVPKWDGVLNATAFGATCPQFGPQWVSIGGVAEAKEDCLFLNVYAPSASLPSSSSSDNAGAGAGLPVMVYFPAGQFMWGSGNDGENFNAPQTAAGTNPYPTGIWLNRGPWWGAPSPLFSA